MTPSFWMVYGLHQSAPTARHKKQISAIDEARRLARTNPGVEFFVLETTHHVVKHDVSVTPMRGDGRSSVCDADDDVPF